MENESIKNTWLTKIVNNTDLIVEMYDGEDSSKNVMVQPHSSVDTPGLVFPWIDFSKPGEEKKSIKILSDGRFRFHIFQHWELNKIRMSYSDPLMWNAIQSIDGDTDIMESKVLTIRSNGLPYLTRSGNE